MMGWTRWRALCGAVFGMGKTGWGLEEPDLNLEYSSSQQDQDQDQEQGKQKEKHSTFQRIAQPLLYLGKFTLRTPFLNTGETNPAGKRKGSISIRPVYLSLFPVAVSVLNAHTFYGISLPGATVEEGSGQRTRIRTRTRFKSSDFGCRDDQ